MPIQKSLRYQHKKSYIAIASLIVLTVVAFLLVRASLIHAAAASTASYPAPTDVAVTPYGSVGKWMLKSNGQVANYGGQRYQGKTLIETINVMIIDQVSQSPSESKTKINTSMARAGFPAQPIHSTGFKGLIEGKVYGQLPSGILDAYADDSFLVKNNHGRLFGPVKIAGIGYVYSGAFSTEKVGIYNWLPAHLYVSSNDARDALVRKLVAKGNIQSTSVDLYNAYNTSETTTGDHDGKAAVVIVK